MHSVNNIMYNITYSDLPKNIFMKLKYSQQSFVHAMKATDILKL